MKKDARHARKLLWWQTKPCPAWCDFKDDHEDDTEAEDRSCFSKWEGKVHLTLSEDGGDYQVRADGKKKFWPPNLNVSLRQHYRELGPRVVLGFDQTSTTFDLTAGEARALADQLVKGADLADGHWGD